MMMCSTQGYFLFLLICSATNRYDQLLSLAEQNEFRTNRYDQLTHEKSTSTVLAAEKETYQLVVDQLLAFGQVHFVQVIW
jgi:transcriptional antiterminator Rof (Rho-off)